MFAQTLDPQAQARRALGKVYALLYRLADESHNEQKAVNVQPLAGETLTVEQQSDAHSQEAQP